MDARLGKRCAGCMVLGVKEVLEKGEVHLAREFVIGLPKINQQLNGA